MNSGSAALLHALKREREKKQQLIEYIGYIGISCLATIKLNFIAIIDKIMLTKTTDKITS
jgi:hypothetical protein